MKTNLKRSLLASAVALACGNALGAEYWLCAGTFSKTMPDGSSVTMWGYAQDDDSDLTNGCGAGAYSSPGPRLTVPVGEASLTIHLRNNLPTPTSLVIPGQTASESGAMVPVKVAGRMHSFTHEVAQGTTGVYTWDLRPGSYAYQTGTHPAVQVQMGLFGALTQDAAASSAYTGVPYSNEVMQFYSEIDPALHTAVAGGTYGPGRVMTSTINYNPKWFLVNGDVFVDPSPAAPATIQAGNVNETTLIRFFNMGLRSHTMVLQGTDMKLAAEDGHLVPTQHNQYSLMVAAGKTQDVTIIPTTPGTLPLYERQHNLTTSTGTAKKTGGLMSFLQVGGTSPNPVGVADPYSTDEDVALNVSAPGVLGNDYDPQSDPLTTQLISGPAHALSFTLNDDGSFSYTPVGNYNGPDGFIYKASDGTYLSANTSVSITVNPVNDAPVAVADADTVAEGGTVNIAVLTNDSDVDIGTTLTPVIDTSPTNGTATLNPDGTIAYIHNGGETTSDSFTYHVSDGSLPSATVTVSVTVTPVNDAPVAVNDGPYATPVSTVLNVAAPGLLANDTDVDGPSMSAVGVTQPTHGAVTVNADGSFSYTPTLGYAGPDSFTYQVNDGAASNNLSNVATVSIDVQGATNTAPVAVNDTSFLYRQNVLRTVNYAGPLGLGVLANDTDAENQALSAQVVTNPAAGTLTLNSAGSFTYLRNGTGNTTFTYRANDGQGVNNLSNNATVTMRTDAAPTANADNCLYDVSAQTVTQPARCSVTAPRVVRVNVALNDTDSNVTTNIPTDGVGKTVVPGSAVITAVGAVGVDVVASACQAAIPAGVGIARGTITNNCDGTVTIAIAAANTNSTISYTYRIGDDLGALSNARQNSQTVQP
jgi:VCBS repeat-containing protein